MFDWNNNGERDAFDFAMDMMVLEEMEREEKQERLDMELLGTGYDRFDLENMDEEERNQVLEDAGLDADAYDFE